MERRQKKEQISIDCILLFRLQVALAEAEAKRVAAGGEAAGALVVSIDDAKPAAAKPDDAKPDAKSANPAAAKPANPDGAHPF